MTLWVYIRSRIFVFSEHKSLSLDRVRGGLPLFSHVFPDHGDVTHWILLSQWEDPGQLLPCCFY